MRRAAAILVLVAVVAGCTSTRFNWFKPDESKVPVTPGNLPSVEAVVAYLNDNASRIQNVHVRDLDIETKIGLQTVGLRGWIMAEKPTNPEQPPRSFRMKAKSPLGGDMADLGSNSEEFWFWGAKDNPPYLYYCPYKDLGAARSLPIPFQPEWIVEALGMGAYGPPSRYQPLEAHGDTIHLIEKTKSPQGMPVRKVIVMKSYRIDPEKSTQPQVTAFLLLDDATGQEICSAHISQIQFLGKPTNAVLPKKVELKLPAQKVALKLTLSGVQINTPLQPTVFVRPQMTGVESFNLARGQTDSALQRVQGVNPPAYDR